MKYIFILLFFLITAPVVAQDSFKISGRVIDDTGSPIDGATVTLDGTSIITITSADGGFELSSTANRVVLKISYVGFASAERTLVLPILQKLIISMQRSNESLSEVVVSTGYQELPKERVTGSFEQLSPALLNRSVSPNIISRIEGLSPAVFFDNRSYNVNSPFTSNNLLVRGLNTINSNPDPLIILDNFPYEGNINDINPNDVESITILKDAAAASIWGARAGNGVIVINSKKGMFDKPTSISFTSNVNITARPDLTSVPQLSSSDFIDVEQFLFSRGFYNSQETNVRKPALTPVVELLIAWRDGKISPADLERQLNLLRGQDVRDDFNKYVYRPATNQQYALNISGGGENNSYLVSAGYDRKLQSLVMNNNNRLTLKAENTFKPLKGMQLFGRISYAASDIHMANFGSGIGFGEIRPVNKELYPYAMLADKDGNHLPVDKDYRSSYTRSLGNGLLLDWQYRPLDEIEQADRTESSTNLLVNTGMNYKVSSWLDADIKYQFTKVKGNSNELYGADTYFIRNLVNRYTQISGTQVTRPFPLGGMLDAGHTSLNGQSLRTQLNLAKSWSGKYEVSGLAGAEVRETHSVSSSSRAYGYDENLLTTAVVDLVTSFPAYSNIAASSTIPYQASMSELTDRFVSFYANAGFTFDNRYSLTLSARKDASNLFGVATNQKGIPLGSAGLAWNISNEKFYQSSLIPFLKLRSSFGYSGNTNNQQTSYTTMIYQNPSNLHNLRFAYVRNPADANLRWEKVGTLNIGIDISTARNRLSGSLDLYSKKTSDLFGIDQVDPTSGFNTATINGASTKARGLELILNSRNLTGIVQWNTNFMLGYNKTVVVKYGNSPTASSSIVSGGFSVSPVTGYLVYPLFSHRFAGLDKNTGDPIGYVAGAESKDYSALVSRTPLADLVFHGSAIPLWNGSVRNSISWNNITLLANVTFRLNYYFRRPTINYASLVNSHFSHPDYNLRWQKPGDEANTSVPSFQYPAVTNRESFHNSSENTVEKGDHVRLRDIRLSYDLRKQSMPKLPLNSAEFFIYASDLGILWRANNYRLDPDYSPGIPPSRSIAAGLRVNL